MSVPEAENKMYELYYQELRGKRVPLANLARGWGVPVKSVRRDFKWWCRAHNLDPRRFYVRGYTFTGYWVPREFVEWWEEVCLPQYQRHGHARSYFDWGAVKRKRGKRHDDE